MTREEWLTEAVLLLDAQVFAPVMEGVIPDLQFRVSCSFPGGPGKKKGVVGQCWNPSASADSTTEIYISPVEDNPVEVLDTLVHENVHRIVGCKHGHKAPFKRLAVKVGLEGKMTSTHAGEALRETLTGLAETLGTYPHAKVTPGEGKKKQSTRMLKVVCTECDNVARQALTPFKMFGLVCGGCEVPMRVETGMDDV
tara:strand:+ start:149 stop:739 length:591 start_codon:yes stop_codon:yes gene_type:complete